MSTEPHTQNMSVALGTSLPRLEPTRPTTGEALYNAVAAKDALGVRDIVARSDFNSEDLKGYHGPSKDIPVLQLAIGKGDLAITNILIDAHVSRGVSLNIKDRHQQRTPLHYAAYMDRYETVIKLISLQVPLDTLDVAGRTPGHLACSREPSQDSSAIMKTLIGPLIAKDPSLINQKAGESARCRTYLHWLALRNRADDLLWLLDNHANPLIEDSDQLTAWDCAWRSNSFAVLGALVRREHKTGLWENRPNDSRTLTEYVLEKNNIPAIYGILRAIMGDRDHSAEKIDPVIDQILRDLARYARILEMKRSPNSSCVFELPLSQEVTSREARGQIQESDGRWNVDLTPTIIEDTINEIRPSYLSIVMPFLHCTAVVAYEYDQSEKHLKAMWERAHFCRSASQNAPVGVLDRVPLDEYCSPFLFDNDLARKNKYKDQVLTRVTQNKDQGMVTVSQSWIWAFDTSAIISPLWVASLEEAARRRLGYETTSLPKRIGIVLSDMIEQLEKISVLDTFWGNSILEYFEMAVIQVSVKVNAYLEEEGIESIKRDREEEYLHEIDDVREELSMIARVLAQQEDVWTEFATNAWPNYWATGRMAIPVADLSKIPLSERKIWKKIMQPQELFERYKRRISQINADAERVQGTIMAKLDLKGKHASIREAHSTAIMSAAVLGFTVITIIFTPLSFIIALFALPIQQFQDNQVNSIWGNAENPSGVYTTNYIGKYTAVVELVSICLTVLLMWLAIKFCIGGPLFMPQERKKHKKTFDAPGAIMNAAQTSAAQLKAAQTNRTQTNNGPTTGVKTDAAQAQSTRRRILWSTSRANDLEVGKAGSGSPMS